MDQMLGPKEHSEHIRKVFTFDGGAGSGAIGTFLAFTIPGTILIIHLGVTCTTDLVGATATISLGVASDVDGFIAVTTATDIDAGETWTTATPSSGIVSEPAVLRNELVSIDLSFDILVANITAGVLELALEYEPVVMSTVVT